VLKRKGDKNQAKQTHAKLQAKYKDIFLVVDCQETDGGDGLEGTVRENHVITGVTFCTVNRRWSVQTNEVIVEEDKIVGMFPVPNQHDDDSDEEGVEDKRRVIAIGEPLHAQIRRSTHNSGLHLVGSDGRSVV
jgi:hypothetical protein